MAEKRYLLSESDRDSILFVLEWIKKQPGGRRSSPTPLPELGSGPRLYVCRVPSGGIAALTDSSPVGTGSTDAPGDVPGVTECYVYRVLRTGGASGTPYLSRVDNLRLRVHNLGKIAVPAGAWVTVHRDEWGAWFVASQGLDFTECP